MNKRNIKKMAKSGVDEAKKTLLNVEGSEYASCSMSYDLGYYSGMLRCLELLKKAKPMSRKMVSI